MRCGFYYLMSKRSSVNSDSVLTYATNRISSNKPYPAKKYLDYVSGLAGRVQLRKIVTLQTYCTFSLGLTSSMKMCVLTPQYIHKNFCINSSGSCNISFCRFWHKVIKIEQLMVLKFTYNFTVRKLSGSILIKIKPARQLSRVQNLYWCKRCNLF